MSVWPWLSASWAMTAGPAVAVESGFIFDPDDPPTPQCHASTIAETTGGALVAAWFAGTREKHPDVGIAIARCVDGAWSAPVEVVTGVTPAGHRYPCWNPVLCQPSAGPLLLFFKVGASIDAWWGELIVSDDGGETWHSRRALPNAGIGPVKNKPVELPDGTLLCPSSSEHHGWRVHFELTRDAGRTWRIVLPIHDGVEWPAIQPTILTHPDGRLQALCRTSDRGVICQTWSADGGLTWSDLTATDLPNPNSGIDAATLADGRHLLVYNPQMKGRNQLAVAVSEDGLAWREAVRLEDQPDGEFSYPAVIQARDGRVHVTYTWRRRAIRHVVLDPATL